MAVGEGGWIMTLQWLDPLPFAISAHPSSCDMDPAERVIRGHTAGVGVSVYPLNGSNSDAKISVGETTFEEMERLKMFGLKHLPFKNLP